MAQARSDRTSLITLRIPNDLLTALRAEAIAEDTSLAWVIIRRLGAMQSARGRPKQSDEVVKIDSTPESQ